MRIPDITLTEPVPWEPPPPWFEAATVGLDRARQEQLMIEADRLDEAGLFSEAHWKRQEACGRWAVFGPLAHVQLDPPLGIKMEEWESFLP